MLVFMISDKQIIIPLIIFQHKKVKVFKTKKIVEA